MSNKNKDAVTEICSVYAKRDEEKKHLLYTWSRPEVRFDDYRFQAKVCQLLKNINFSDFSSVEMLDVGCGSGAWLRQVLEWGGNPKMLHGIDILEDRIGLAKSLSPHLDFQVCDGLSIPFGEKSMSMVTANTVFSSIRSSDLRTTLANEMIRVLKNDGIILVSDFRISHPLNKNTIGINLSEIKRLFPNFRIRWSSLTLAPPLSRCLAPFSPLLVHVLEVFFPLLRTHGVFLVSIEDCQ